MGALKVYNGATARWEYTTGSGGGTMLAYKTADEGLVNTATLQNDDELFLTVPAAGTYVLDALLIFTGPTNTQVTNAGIKVTWTLPAGATCRIHQFGPGLNASNTYDPAVLTTGDLTARPIGTFGTGTDVFARYHGTITVPSGGAGGVVRLTWAPNVVHATLYTYMRTGSFLKLDAGGSGSGGGGGGGSGSGGSGISTPAAYAGRYMTTGQNIPAGVVTTVLWDTVTAPPVGIVYNAATGEFTVTAAGIYTIAASAAWPSNTTGNARSTIIQVNGVTRAQTGLPPSAVTTTGMGVEVVHTLSLVAGDKISVQVYQNSTANPLALYPSEAFSRIAITANGGSSSGATALAMAKYTNTGVQSIPNATWTRITNLTTIWLDGGATRTTDYIVVPTTGRYAIAGYVGWASYPSGTAFRRIVGIGRNWTIATPDSNIIGSTETPGTSGQTTYPSCRYYEEHDLVAGDMICLLAYQNSGIAINTMTTTQDTMLSVRQIPLTTSGGEDDGSAAIIRIMSAPTNQTITASTFTTVTLPTTVYDSGQVLDAVNGHFTIPEDGLYVLTGTLTFDSNAAAGRRLMQLESFTNEAVGAGAIRRRVEQHQTAATAQAGLALPWEYWWPAGTKLRMVAWHNATGAALDNANFPAQLSLHKIDTSTGGGRGGGGNTLVGVATQATDNALTSGTETMRQAASFIGRTGQQYVIKALCHPQNSVATNYTIARLRWDTAFSGVTGTLMQIAIKDHRSANRPEALYLESPPFTYTGTDKTTLYGKLTMAAMGAAGQDSAGTYGPTWVAVEAVASVGSDMQPYLMLKGGSTNLATQFADAVWSNVSVPNTLTSVGSAVTAVGNVVTVAQSGLYTVSAGLIMGISGTLRRVVGVESFVAEALGSGTPLMRTELSGAASVYPTFALSGDVYLAANTKIRLIGYQNQGGGTALAQRDDLMSAYFNVRKVD